tara:strand:+ start:4673 stop:5605 length:933 start_codon:yes stop_codon:yes gene_type:complete
MSRHLLIGDGTASNVSSGVEAAGAVSIQKMTESGPAALVIGETFVDAPQIRIIQGTSGNNIVSPWIYGRDVINFSGKSYVAPTAHTGTVVASGSNSSSDGTVVVKFVKVSGPKPEFFSFATEIASGQNNATSGTDIHNAFEALDNIPDWLNPLAADSGAGTATFSGALRGATAQSGRTWDYEPVVFNVILESSDVGTQVFTATSGVADASPGVGDGFAVKALEDALMGVQYGYYNRVELPIAPANTAATGSTYDMYNISATKDGSSSSQINGVDNLIEINVAMVAGDTDNLPFENALNAYFAGQFASVVL